MAANLRVRISQRSVLVALILKDVGIDRANAHALRGCRPEHSRNVGQAIGEIPENVNRDTRATAGEPMHHAGVGQLLFRVRRSRCLNELAEPRSRIRESPRREFYRETVQSLVPQLGLLLTQHFSLARQGECPASNGIACEVTGACDGGSTAETDSRHYGRKTAARKMGRALDPLRAKAQGTWLGRDRRVVKEDTSRVLQLQGVLAGGQPLFLEPSHSFR